MTTKLVLKMVASPLKKDNTRDWKFEGSILVATDETDPGATPDSKAAEKKLAEKILQVIEKILDQL